MSYTNKTKIENYLMTNIDSSMDDQIGYWIEAVEKFINNYTNRPEGFEKSESDEVRYYDGNGKRELYIDDFVSITKVEILEYDGGDVEYTLTEGDDEDFIVYPYNKTPKYKLILTPSSSVSAFYSGPKRIKVTGKFGYANTVPKDIELAATILVGEIIKEGKDGGMITNESLGDYSAGFEVVKDKFLNMNNVRIILDRYKVFKI